MKSLFSEGPARIGTDYYGLPIFWVPYVGTVVRYNGYGGYGTVGTVRWVITVGTVGAGVRTDRTHRTVPTVPTYRTLGPYPEKQSIALEIRWIIIILYPYRSIE